MYVLLTDSSACDCSDISHHRSNTKVPDSNGEVILQENVTRFQISARKARHYSIAKGNFLALNNSIGCYCDVEIWLNSLPVYHLLIVDIV